MVDLTAGPLAIEVHDATEEQWTTQMYIAMVRTPEPCLASLVKDGFTERQVELGTRALERRELIESLGEDKWRVRPPDVALRQLATNWETRAQFARAGALELSAVWRQTRQNSDSRLVSGMRALRSADEVVEALETTWREANEEFAVIVDDSIGCRRWLLGPPRLEDRWVKRDSVSERYLVNASLMDDPEAMVELQRRADAGASVRIAREVPFGLMTIDKQLVVCDSTRYSDDAGGSFVHTGGPGVAALVSLVETLLAGAAPLSPTNAAGAGSADHPLNPRDRRILGLLAVGATDQQIARSLGISTRTVERRVRTIMDAVGAGTRFQAGVLAAQRDWL